MASPSDAGPRRILIAATPKTGNTWAKLLLSKLYGLPVANLREPFLTGAWDDLGDAWVAHQHVLPGAALQAWARENDVAVLTTIRHPGDVLVSLFHYSRWAAKNRDTLALAQDGSAMGANTGEYVESLGFAGLLDISLQWLVAGAHVVRYEDLVADPVRTLHGLSAHLGPAPRERCLCAAASCEIGLLRKLKGHEPEHFRSGKAGEWRTAIPGEILDVMRTHPRYQTICRELGYSFAASSDPPREPFDYASISPFHGRAHFSNGVAIPPIAIELYFADPAHLRRWPDPVGAEGAGSYFEWLGAWAEPIQSPPDAGPMPTNLGAYIHRRRQDVQRSFPDPLGADRLRFCVWMTRNGQPEYAIPDALLERMLARIPPALRATSG